MTTENKAIDELIQEAEDAPEPGTFERRQLIHAAEDEVPADLQVSALESAGYVYMYDTHSGERRITNRNMLPDQLKKLRPDGSRVFTTAKPSFSPARGTYLCMLHPDQPERAKYDAMGLATCYKDNLTSPYQVRRHTQVRHSDEWATLEEERIRQEQEEERNFQRQLLSAASQARQAPPPTPKALQLPNTTDCGCGATAIKPSYRGLHLRTKKHTRWAARQGEA